MSADDLERAEQLVAAATPGPWRTDEDGCCVYAGMPDDPHPIAHVVVDAQGTEADAEFIAAARELVPALVAQVRTLTEAGNRLAVAIKAQVEHGYPVSIIVTGARADWRAVVGEP